MAEMDLSHYNLGELKGLQFEIEQEIKGRKHGEIRKARDQILTIAQSLGLSVDDLLASSGTKSKGTGKKVQPHYRNPANHAQTWSGRGRQPKWMVEGLADGKSLDEFRI